MPSSRSGTTLTGGFAGVNERTRQLASAKLPPGLQAKLEANAKRSAASGVSGAGSNVLGHNQMLNSSALLSAEKPTVTGPGGTAGSPTPLGRQGPTPGAALRNRPALRLSDMGVNLGDGRSKPGGASEMRRPNKPTLGKLPEANGTNAMATPFSNFSKIVDPSGRLNFEGKAVLHASGVEFKNGTSFNINMQELELLEQLGFGNYGTVSKARHTRTKVEMAVKEIRLELDEAKLNAIIMELDILHRAIAPQIVEFYGAFFIESCVYYCMEYMDAGSLERLCAGRRCCVPEPVLARITSSTVKGLSFLKDELQIIHRDVKPTNILLNKRGEVKLCDFGVSGQLEKSLAKTNIGCQSYMAPERIKGDAPNTQNTYTTASDVWSLGLSLVEITMGTYPYPPETFANVFAQLQAIVDGPAPTLPHPSKEPITVISASGVQTELELGPYELSPTAHDFVAHCLRKDPEQRPTYAELLAHPFLQRDEQRTDAEVDMAGWVRDSLETQALRKKAAEQAASDTEQSEPETPSTPRAGVPNA